MPRLARSRPPLPRFAVAWFPAFAGLDRIEAFRRRHDPAAGRIAAHVSLVFPFPTPLTALQVETHVRRDLPYEPHITLARYAVPAPLEAAFAEARAEFRDEPGDMLREVTLLAVGDDGRIVPLQRIALHTP